MKVVSVNISKPQEITVNGKPEITGYFKTAVDAPVYLTKNNVTNDFVADTVHHGGIDKACYLYGLNNYQYWKNKYPDLDYEYGIFGENITLDVLDESKLKIGDTFKIGDAIIQVSQPRQPCYKLGFRFNDQKIVNEFRLASCPGAYVRVLQDGKIKKGDALQLIESFNTTQTVLDIYRLVYKQTLMQHEANEALNNPYLANNVKTYLTKKLTP